MNRQKINDVFKTDENGKFIHLVIPQMGEFPEIDLTGKAKLELSLDEVVRLKKYANDLYSHMEG